MKLLAIHPGASTSTSDVYDGLVPELRKLGAEIIPYRLDERIERSGAFLHWQWIRWAKRNLEYKPGPADVLYLAGQGVLEMALRKGVDGVLIFSCMYLHPDWLHLLRRAGVRTAVVLSESPYDDERHLLIAPLVDLLWTNERSSVPVLRSANPNVRYLPHSWSPLASVPEVLNPVASHDVVLVGTGFSERVETLSAVNWDGIDLGLYGAWVGLGSRHRLRRHVRDGLVSNATAQALYRRAKVGLNLYRTSKGFGKHAPRILHAESLNPRAYELAAAGLVHVSDYRAEVPEVFGDSVPTFSGPRELETIVRDLLADSATRQRLSESLPARVAHHTSAARAAQLLSDLHEASSSKERIESAV